MANLLWPICYGQSVMANLLWPICYGQYVMANTLWPNTIGKLTLIRYHFSARKMDRMSTKHENMRVFVFLAHFPEPKSGISLE